MTYYRRRITVSRRRPSYPWGVYVNPKYGSSYTLRFSSQQQAISKSISLERSGKVWSTVVRYLN